MANNNSSHYLMPTFDSEEAFNAYFAKETAAVAPYRDSQGHLVLDDIHDLPKVIDKVFEGIPNSPILSFLKTDLQICARCVQ